MRTALKDSFARELAFLRTSTWDLALVTWIPFLLMAILAIQLSTGVIRDLPVVVVDQDGGGIARELTRRMEAAPGLTVSARVFDMADAEDLVRANRAYAVLLIPQGTDRNVLRGETAQVFTFYNASYSTASSVALREMNAVIQSYGGTLAIQQSATVLGPRRVRPPPIAVRSTLLYNPQGSYELQLVALLHPALLHLIFMVVAVSALGRELRDGTIGLWLTGDRRERAARVAGKLLPYLMIFSLWSGVAILYLVARGWPIAGSPAMLMVGSVAMYLAYAGLSVLVVGRTLAMAQSLSIAGLYAGASFAFAGAIFPLEAASAFARIWSSLLPFTAYARLVSEQWVMGVPLSASLPQVGIMLIFALGGTAIGLNRYLAAADTPTLWGRR